jgi:hypothetical protein
MKIKRLLCVIGLVLSATLADAALTTNSWQVNSGKWEIGVNWNHGVPAPSNSIDFLDETIPSGTTRTITIDQTTVLSNALNNCLTISNLTLSGTSMDLQVLLLTNAALTTPLTIISNLTLNAHTFVTISNAAMSVGVTSAGTVSDDGGVTLLGGVLIATNVSTSFVIGNTGAGVMTVQGGTWQARTASVGGNAASHGTLMVAGGTNTLSTLNVGALAGSAGEVWMTGGRLTVTNANVGNSGVGQMTVSNGTWLSQILIVGNQASSQGTLTIAGGTNIVMVSSIIGNNAQSTGTVWMIDGLLVATGAETVVGAGGVGQMTVSNGTWQTPVLMVANGLGSQGTLTIAGGTVTLAGENPFGQPAFIVGNGLTASLWVTGGQLITSNSVGNIGWYGTGQMGISNGTWLAGDITVGYKVGSDGTLTFAGGTNVFSSFLTVGGYGRGTAWLTAGQLAVTNGSSIVGSNGMGSMTISNGTWLARDVKVGTTYGAQGTLTIAGGTCNAYSGLTIGTSDCSGTGTVIVAAGSLFATNAAHDAVLDLENGSFTLNSGMVVVDTFVLTNACAHFVRTGGTLIYGSAVLNPNDDTDGDGIPNGYEQAHGLDPLNGSNATMDSDGDGMTDLQEYLAGTDPTNSASSFRITSIAQTGNNVLVTWMMGPGKTNALQVTSGAGGGAYTTNSFANLFIVTNTVGTIINYLDAGGATNIPARYYRIRLVP